jgi:hypothetical protein
MFQQSVADYQSALVLDDAEKQTYDRTASRRALASQSLEVTMAAYMIVQVLGVNDRAKLEEYRQMIILEDV